MKTETYIFLKKKNEEIILSVARPDIFRQFDLRYESGWMDSMQRLGREITHLSVNCCVCACARAWRALHISEQWTPHLLVTSSASKMQTTPPTSLTVSHSCKVTNASSASSFIAVFFFRASVFSLFNHLFLLCSLPTPASSSITSCHVSSPPSSGLRLPLTPSFLSCHMSARPCRLSQLTSRKQPLTDKHKMLCNAQLFFASFFFFS